MRIILEGKIQKKVIDTEYNIGDIVILKNTVQFGKSYYRPLLCDKLDVQYDFKTGELVQSPSYWPVEVLLRFTVNDISMSVSSGKLVYSISYSNERLIFPAGGCSVGIDEIKEKVESNDYESDPIVVKWCEEMENRIKEMNREKETMHVKEDPTYYFISDPNPENKGTGNRTIRKTDWRLKQKDWVVMWSSGDTARKPYILDRDWVTNHAFDAKSSNERTEFMLISEKDIEKYICEHCMSKPLF